MKIFTSIILSLLIWSAPLAAKDLWVNLFEENLAKAEGGDQEAAYQVGIMYLKGQGVAANRDKAAEWLKSAADAGNDSAAAKLSRMHANEQEFREILGNAEKGDASAQYEAAMMFASGKGTSPDPKQAAAWLEKASEQGNVKATARLGILLLKGEGVPAAPKRGVDMLTQASGQEVLAQYYLGEAYAEGLGVRRDYSQAITWYQKAADNGFARAAGKIINLEEEIRMDERRKEREQREASERANAERAAAERAAAAAAEKAAAAKAKAAKAKVAEAVIIERDIKYLAGYNWTTDGKAANFLPSSLNDCEMETDRLVCYSSDIEEISVGRKLRYRVKAIITPGAVRESFDVIYRNLVLDVEMLDVDNGPVGYGSGEDRGFKVKTGWTKQHTASCRYTTDRTVDCIKDGAHEMTAVQDNNRTLSAKR